MLPSKEEHDAAIARAADRIGLTAAEREGWNPLDNTGHALSLMTKLQMTAWQGESGRIYLSLPGEVCKQVACTANEGSMSDLEYLREAIVLRAIFQD